MNIYLIEEEVKALTDEEIILCKNLHQNFNSKNNFQFSNDLLKIIGIGGLGTLLGSQYFNSNPSITRRGFIQKTLAATTLAATSNLILTSDDEAEAIWGFLIGAVVGAVAAVGVMAVASYAFSGSGRRHSYERTYSGRYSTTDHTNVVWKHNDTGETKVSLLNDTDVPKSGCIVPKLIDKNSNSTEMEDRIGLEVKPFHKSKYSLKFEQLPYTGEKKVTVKSKLNLKTTDNSIIVL